jgi:hypothetical protein
MDVRNTEDTEGYFAAQAAFTISLDEEFIFLTGVYEDGLTSPITLPLVTSLDDVMALLPETLSVYANVNGEENQLIEIPVEWICESGYVVGTAGSYTFTPSYDEEAYPVMDGSNLDISQAYGITVSQVDMDYQYDTGTATLTIYTNEGTSSWRDDPAIGLGLKHVVTTATVTEVSEGAFEGCEGLVTVSFAEGLITLGERALYNASALSSVTLPSTLRTIGSQAFSYTSSLTGLTLPEGLVTVENGGEYGTFYDSGLTSINIPASVTTFDLANELGSCSDLATVTVADGNSVYQSVDGVVFDKAGETLILYPSARDAETYTVPEGVTSIGQCFAGNQHLVTLTLPSTLATLTNGSFSNSSLTGIIFTSDETDATLEIGTGAFKDASNLVSLVLPDNVTSIGSGALIGCTALESVTLPKNLKSLEDTNPGMYVGELGLGACPALKEISISTDALNYTTFDNVLFSKDRSTLLLYPHSRVGESYTVPESVTTIGEKAFYMVSTLRTVYIGENITAILAQAFSGCSNMKLIGFRGEPNLTVLGDGAFLDCGNPSEILSIFLPRAVPDHDNLWYLFRDPDTGESKSHTKVFVYPSSPIETWLKTNGISYDYRPDSTALVANPPPLMYQYIPYQFTPATAVTDNENMVFSLGEGETLPEGLSIVTGPTIDADGMIPGTIYGAPLDYEDFTEGISFTLYARNEDDIDGYFGAQATFTISLAEVPDEEVLLNTINDLPFTEDEKTGDSDGMMDSNIEGHVDDVEDQVLHIDGEYSRFDGLWIDGNKQTRDVDYTAEEGSTRVTILAQTVKDLENGNHTVAASFTRTDANDNGSQLDIAAQNFSVNIDHSPKEPEPTPSSEPTNPSETTPSSEPTSPSETTPSSAPTNPSETTPSSEPTSPSETPSSAPTSPSETPSSAPTSPSETTPSSKPTSPSETTPSSAPTSPSETTPSSEPTSPTATTPSSTTTSPSATTSSSAQTSPSATTPSNAQTTTSQTDSNKQASLPNQSKSASTEESTKMQQSGTPTSQENRNKATSAGESETESSSTEIPWDDTTGQYTVAFVPLSGGAGQEITAHIDLPLKDFQSLTCDGELLTYGEDYTTSEGSTILTLNEAVVAKLSVGSHVLLAAFNDITIDIPFQVEESQLVVKPNLQLWMLIPISAILMVITGVIIFLQKKKNAKKP